MAKNVENKRCVHCLTIPEEITYDHVIPKAWYSTKSRNIRKLKAPACYPCNNSLGKQEKLVSHLMWMCMPETHPLKNELTEKVYRACGISTDGTPLLGLNDSERHIRKLYAKELLSLTIPASSIKDENLFPGFGYHAGYPKEIQRGVRLDVKLLLDVASKVIRGLEYSYRGSNRYIETPYTLEVYFPKDSSAPTLELIRKKSLLFHDMTNTIQRGADPSKPLEPIYIIRLWDQWEIWGVIVHE